MQRATIHTLSPEMLGAAIRGTVGLTGAWPASNDAIFVPLTLSRPVLVKRLFSHNGNTIAGNIDMGIYTVDGARIVSNGSTAQAGNSVLQFFNITDTYLSPGNYYLACAKNDASGRVARYQPSLGRLQSYGVMKMATAFALPASATFATVTATYLPSIGLEMVGAL